MSTKLRVASLFLPFLLVTLAARSPAYAQVGTGTCDYADANGRIIGNGPCRPTGGGGNNTGPTGPSAAERARQQAEAARRQAEAARQQATVKARELKGAGFLSMEKGNYRSALPKLREALSQVSPYANDSYNDAVKELYDIRQYIAISEAHVAEANGDLDLAVSLLDKACGLGGCAQDDHDYYFGLKKRRETDRVFAQNKQGIFNLMDNLARDSERERFETTQKNAGLLMDELLANSKKLSTDCTGTNAAKCQLESAAGNSGVAVKNPKLEPSTNSGIPREVRPPEGPVATGPGPIATEEGTKEKAGCWADGGKNCASTQPNPTPPPINSSTPTRPSIPKALAEKPEFRELLRQSTVFTGQIQKIDARLEEIRKQRDSGKGNRAALDQERITLINRESYVKAQRKIVDNKVEQEIKNFSVGFDEEKPAKSGTKPNSKPVPKPGGSR